jgi:hypothetical protein
LYGAFYGRAGRLNAQNGGFRRGQDVTLVTISLAGHTQDRTGEGVDFADLQDDWAHDGVVFELAREVAYVPGIPVMPGQLGSLYESPPECLAAQVASRRR